MWLDDAGFVGCVGAVQNNSRHEPELRSSAVRKPKQYRNEGCAILLSQRHISLKHSPWKLLFLGTLGFCGMDSSGVM